MRLDTIGRTVKRFSRRCAGPGAGSAGAAMARAFNAVYRESAGPGTGLRASSIPAPICALRRQIFVISSVHWKQSAPP